MLPFLYYLVSKMKHAHKRGERRGREEGDGIKMKRKKKNKDKESKDEDGVRRGDVANGKDREG